MGFFALLPLFAAFAITFLVGMPIINWLRKMKFGQKILEIGPKWHMNKQNIPTMGGLMFILGISAAMVLALLLAIFLPNLSAPGSAANENVRFFLTSATSGFASGFAVLLLALAYGMVGFVDDFAKIKKKQNAGLTPLQKLILQIVVAAVFITLLRITGAATPAVWVPFTTFHLELPWIVYIVFAAFVIVGGDNAVNLTDGIDGLAAGVTLPVALFFLCVGLRQDNPGVIIFSAALAGALIAFLIFNWSPAKVFMGDTGSLFLGGAVTGLAFACDMPLILIPVGIIYIWETLSVIIQVGYFKLSHGKRVFKMAPFHHHMEMCGWSEKKIVLTFAGITTLLCVLAWLGAQPVLPPL